ncbi:hypothetical protein [Aquimarina rhabdastrellae]
MRITLLSIAAITALFSIFMFKTTQSWLIISSGSVAFITGSIAAYLAKKELKSEKSALLFALIGVMIILYRVLN